MSKYYIIKSKLNDYVLDADSGNKNPGTLVFTFQKHGGENQQWYDDTTTGTIRSKLNDFCLDTESGQLVINPYVSGKHDQQWERRGEAIVNRHDNMVLDIFGGNKDPKAKVIKFEAKGTPNQAWDFEQAP